MSAPLQLESLAFDPAAPKAALNQLPTAPAVFALYSADAHAEPYIGRTPNLRARLERLLQPSPKHPRRLQLAGRVRQICWRLTGSDFESLLVQFELLEKVHGPKCLERMHLRQPAFIRFLGSNAYPRIAVTHRPSQREADWAYGPFQSRATAERFADEALKLFLLRRCTDDLAPHPDHPGCVYSEMKMCLAPCYQGCTDERYAEEASAVQQFIATRGESRLVTLRTQREEASANLEFEAAAALHSQVQRIEVVRALAPELVRPLSQLRAVLLQASALPGEVAVFLYENGRLSGPVAFSTLGMRIQNERSGSTSLFAQPMAIEAIPEAPATETEIAEQKAKKIEIEPALYQGTTSLAAEKLRSETVLYQGTASAVPQIPQTETGALAPEGNPPAVLFVAESTPNQPAKLARGLLESRLEAALASLANQSHPPSPTLRQGHLALLKCWYYRPELRREGEIFFPDAEGRWPVKAILRGAGRVAASSMLRKEL